MSALIPSAPATNRRASKVVVSGLGFRGDLSSEKLIQNHLNLKTKYNIIYTKSFFCL